MHFIYKIVCSTTHRVYIGRSTNPSARFSIHRRQLRTDSHHNIRLQREFNKYGEESFIFEVLWSTDNFEDCCSMEELIINDSVFSRLLNVSGASTGGDLLKNHPNKQSTISRRVASQIAKLANMTQEERRLKWGRSGVRNGMYGKSHNEHIKEQSRARLHQLRANSTDSTFGGASNVERFGEQKALEISEKLSAIGKQWIGEANHFYGKQHTEEFKKASSERASIRQKTMSIEDRIMHPQTKILVYQNKMYIGASSLARSIGCTAGNVSHMIKTNKCTIIEKEIALLIIQQRFSEVPVEMGGMEIVGYTTPYEKLEMGVAT